MYCLRIKAMFMHSNLALSDEQFQDQVNPVASLFHDRLVFGLWAKEMLMQVEKATIRLKNQDKPIKEIAKTLGATIWQVLKKKECTRLLSNIKRPEKSQKTIK